MGGCAYPIVELDLAFAFFMFTFACMIASFCTFMAMTQLDRWFFTKARLIAAICFLASATQFLMLFGHLVASTWDDPSGDYETAGVVMIFLVLGTMLVIGLHIAPAERDRPEHHVQAKRWQVGRGEQIAFDFIYEPPPPPRAAPKLVVIEGGGAKETRKRPPWLKQAAAV